MTTKTLPMLQAVNDAVEAVRAANEGIPDVVVVLGSSGRKKNSQVHGHFAKQAWRDREEESLRTHELFLSGESLQRGGRETMGTIIHELAHAYCAENDITDTSNHGRYHNKKFKEVAERLGLDIDVEKTIGWSVTEVPNDTAALYQANIEALDAALTSYRDHTLLAASAKKAVTYKMQCPQCQDPVPTGKGWFERNEYHLRCLSHGTPQMFELVVA